MELNFAAIVTSKTMDPTIFFEILHKKNHPLVQAKDFYAKRVGFQHSKFYTFLLLMYPHK
jgi:hypothetical protein